MKNDHIVSVIRIMAIPRARRLKIVATKFRLLIVNDAMNSAMLRIHKLWPEWEPGTAVATALSGG